MLWPRRFEPTGPAPSHIQFALLKISKRGSRPRGCHEVPVGCRACAACGEYLLFKLWSQQHAFFEPRWASAYQWAGFEWRQWWLQRWQWRWFGGWQWWRVRRRRWVDSESRFRRRHRWLRAKQRRP